MAVVGDETAATGGGVTIWGGEKSWKEDGLVCFWISYKEKEGKRESVVYKKEVAQRSKTKKAKMKGNFFSLIRF